MAHALQPRWRCKFVHTTDSRHGLPVAATSAYSFIADLHDAFVDCGTTIY
jgi:hypothetical protein